MPILSIPGRLSGGRSFRGGYKRALAISMNSSALLSPYTITLGDEFQAVYKAGSRVVEDLLFISRSLFPVSLRIALGIDDIATDINTKEAIGMDGPAFHAARDGLNNVKEEKSLLYSSTVAMNKGRGFSIAACITPIR